MNMDPNGNTPPRIAITPGSMYLKDILKNYLNSSHGFYFVSAAYNIGKGTTQLMSPNKRKARQPNKTLDIS